MTEDEKYVELGKDLELARETAELLRINREVAKAHINDLLACATALNNEENLPDRIPNYDEIKETFDNIESARKTLERLNATENGKL